MSEKTVAEYYDRSQKWYDLLWARNRSLGMHYGFHFSTHEGLQEAIINQYKVVAEQTGLTNDMSVLDAGCGVGGAAIWLAKHIGCHVTGITISNVQVKRAIENAEKCGVHANTTFVEMSYFSMEFPDASFDVVYCLESACHAYPNPGRLYDEVFRVLKPGGYFIINDGVMIRKPQTVKEQRLHKKFLEGFALDGGNTVGEVQRALEQSGFSQQHISRTREVLPSVRIVYFLGVMMRLVLWPLWKLRVISRAEYGNVWACINQKYLVTNGVWGYSTFVAKKP